MKEQTGTYRGMTGKYSYYCGIFITIVTVIIIANLKLIDITMLLPSGNTPDWGKL